MLNTINKYQSHWDCYIFIFALLHVFLQKLDKVLLNSSKYMLIFTDVFSLSTVFVAFVILDFTFKKDCLPWDIYFFVKRVE